MEPKTMMDLLEQLQKDKVDPKQYKKHIDLYLDKKARQQGIPLNGTFEITPLCNLDCKMCYVHMYKADLLPIDFWKKIMKEAHEMGMMKALITGGECLTHPDFEEIYLFLQSMGIEVDVFTNGILFDEKKVEFFIRHKPASIQITLYGSNEDTYEKVTGRRVFQTVYQNILRIKEADLPLYIAITPNKYMFEDARNLLELVKELELPYIINSYLNPPRKETNRIAEDLTLDQYVQIHKMKSEINNIALEKEDVQEIPESGTEKRGMLCGGGRSAFSINYQGLISPCSDLMFLSENLKEKSFKEAWTLINEKANNFYIPQECLECPYEKVCNTCPAMHYNPDNPGHKNPLMCKRTLRFIQEGLK